MSDKICPKCKGELEDNIQYSDPCYVFFRCKCGYKSSFECSVYQGEKISVTQHDIDLDYSRKTNPKNRHA